MKMSSTMPVMALLGSLAIGVTACGSSGSTTAASTSNTVSTKTRFCSANVTIDKAAANANSGAEFLGVLKAHTTSLDTLSSDAPSGKVGSEAKALASFAKNAIATNNASAF